MILRTIILTSVMKIKLGAGKDQLRRNLAVQNLNLEGRRLVDLLLFKLKT